MGVDFDAVLFYGMPLGDNIDRDAMWELIEIFEKPDNPLEIMNLNGYSAKSTHMLYVNDSYESGDKNSDPVLVKMSDVTGNESEWRQLIVDACIAYGLTFVEPGWYFATKFS